MGSFRILLVDDEGSLRLTLAANLELAGLEVVEAESGARALEIAETQPFNLVLSDIRMPGMNGVELFRRLRVRHPDTPVVLMTAFALEGLVQEAIEEGAFTVLGKPFDVDSIVPLLMRAIRRPLVLVIDDEEKQAESAALALRATGVSATAVFDGEGAMREIERGNIDVCVLDLMMPGLSGSALVDRIHAVDPSIACIAISGHDVPEMIRRVAQSGAFAFLQKPVAIPELARTIAKARGKQRHL